MVKEKLFENILYEANYGQTPSTIKVKGFDIALKRVRQPIDLMYPKDIIVTESGETFTVGKMIDSKREETVNKGVQARGTIVFSESDDVFETDDPNVFVKRNYDSFMERETITLVDKNGSHDEDTRKIKQQEKDKELLVDRVCDGIIDVFSAAGLEYSRNRIDKDVFRVYRSIRGFKIEAGYHGKIIIDGEVLDPEDLLEDLDYFVNGAYPEYEFTVYYDISERDMEDELNFYVESSFIFE